MKNIFKKVAVVAATAALLTGCAAGNDSKASDLGSKNHPVKIGVVDLKEHYWQDFKAEAEKAGIYVDFKNFNDYNQPDQALAAGELDINQYQHIIYLAKFNVESKKDLQIIGSTATYPLGLYSKKYKKPEEIPAGSTVAVPKDASNQARGLLLLQASGLLKLKNGGSAYSSINDIEPGSKVTVRPLNAELTGSSLDDVSAAVINNDFIAKVNLKSSDAIAKDNPSDPATKPYINIWVVQKNNVDNPTLKKLVEIYQNSQTVKDGVQKANDNTAFFVNSPAAELNKVLAETQDAYSKNKH